MTRLGLIRHGTTDWNAENRLQGHASISLNETGRLQAHAIAERLRGQPWDVLYTSDLPRATETAEIIARATGLSVLTDPRLREMDCGEVEGTTASERLAKWGEHWKALPLGMETRTSIERRGSAFIASVLAVHAGSRILVVSHGVLLRLTLQHLIPHADSSERLRNGSLTQLAYQDDRWECTLYNCVDHL